MWPFDWHQTIYGIIFAVAVFMAFLGHPNPDEAYGASIVDRAAWNPPAEYDHPFPGELIEYRVNPGEVARRCSNWLNQKNIFKRFVGYASSKRGCAFPRGDKCWIVYIDRPAYGTTPEAVRRHEIGHCNGWRHR